MSNTKTPKLFLSLLLLINLERKTPNKIPRIEIPVKIRRNTQSISKVWMSPIKPISEFIVTITSEVPTAFFMGILAQRTSAGTYRNPPPAPIKPVTVPIIKP